MPISPQFFRGAVVFAVVASQMWSADRAVAASPAAASPAISAAIAAPAPPAVATVAAAVPVWHRDVSTAWQQALREDRPLLMYIGTTSCPHCRKMKVTTYADREVATLIGQSVVAVVVDGKRQRKLVRRHRVRSYPTTLVISPDGREIGRFEGYVAPTDFRRRLARAVDKNIDYDRVAERPTRLR